MAVIVENTRYDYNKHYRNAAGRVVSSYAPGTLIAKTGGISIYIIGLDGMAKIFASGDQFNKYKFGEADIKRISAAEMEKEVGPAHVDEDHPASTGLFWREGVPLMTDAEIEEIVAKGYPKNWKSPSAASSGRNWLKIILIGAIIAAAGILILKK